VIKVGFIKRIATAQVEGYTVQGNGVAFTHGVQHCQWLAAFDHEVFTDEFEPVDCNLTAHCLCVERRPQAQPE